MKIQFKNTVQLEVCESYDEEQDKGNFSLETFPPDEIHDVDLLTDHGETINIQFGDGSVCFCIPKTIYTVIEPDSTED
jgi:prepilin-type processing-associated H-X9-DG protein